MNYPVEALTTAVTVYPDRARVNCGGVAQVEAGSHVVTISDLPLALEPDSVRAQGSGTAQVRLRSVDVTQRMYSVAPSERVQELETALDERTRALRAAEDEQAAQEAILAHLDGLRGETKQFARSLARGQLSVEHQAALIQFIQEQDQNARSEIRRLDGETRAILREIDKLTAELNQVRSARPRQRYEVRLDVEVLKAGTFEPEISYVVGQAGWQPLYDMRFTPGQDAKTAAAIRVNYLAEVSQNTGQPWTGVRLSVSTARPALNQRMPELQPWFIDEYHPPQPRHFARAALKSASSANALIDEAPLAMADERYAAEVVVAEARTDAVAVTFDVGGRVDIPGDGTPQKTVIGQFDLEPQLDYYCAPRHTDAVFRRATVTNAGPGPLLAGRVNLFAGDEFIGSNTLDYTPLQGELELMLGVEERIEVERELVRREVDKRLLRDVRQIGYGYEITLRNGLASAVDVVVEDQIPNSRHEQIKIKLESTSPAPEKQSDLHIMTWRVNVAPASTRKIQYHYTVEHPRDMMVAGLAD